MLNAGFIVLQKSIKTSFHAQLYIKCYCLQLWIEERTTGPCVICLQKWVHDQNLIYLYFFFWMQTKEYLGPGQCFCPADGQQCLWTPVWQLAGIGEGDGQIAMAHAPIQIIPGPLQQQRTCWGPGWHSLWPDTGRFGQSLHCDTDPERHVVTEPLLFPCHLLEQKKKKKNCFTTEYPRAADEDTA